MEKQKQKKHGRSRSFTGGGLASFLSSTVASSSSFPSRGNGRSSFNHRNAFSGPIVSIVPPEARGGAGSKRKQSGYRTPEPSSPKVSCIGKIKRSNSKTKKKVNPCGKNGGACPLPPRPTTTTEGRCRPMGSLVKRVFFQRSRSRSKSRDVRSSHGKGSNGVAAAPAPAGLGQMKRFTSGRAAFQDFDWREADIRSGRDQDDEEEEEEDGFVAHWAPLVLGGGVVASEPRKEANLWRRRPMAPPTPLQLP
ncbi:uncharacterized protein At1g76070-like [Phragmites australis]|uniref:uncharacterized protein At1g76070-like n=1 Tax=Phragmites australis TaxID=29695 RepID=UPI002D770526|nr:uncharacterized protein At1g76070-like [Phragmites australis]